VNVLVIAPHPDDETLGCGGTLIRHVQLGDRVSAIFLTSGELGLKQMPQEEAWRVRESEAQDAAQVLGLADVHFLRCPDWFIGDPDLREAIAAYLCDYRGARGHPSGRLPVCKRALAQGARQVVAQPPAAPRPHRAARLHGVVAAAAIRPQERAHLRAVALPPAPDQ